jgi:hypothetical protein
LVKKKLEKDSFTRLNEGDTLILNKYYGKIETVLTGIQEIDHLISRRIWRSGFKYFKEVKEPYFLRVVKMKPTVLKMGTENGFRGNIGSFIDYKNIIGFNFKTKGTIRFNNKTKMLNLLTGGPAGKLVYSFPCEIVTQEEFNKEINKLKIARKASKKKIK